MDIKERVKLQFGRNVANYVHSPLHEEGADLQLLADWVKSEQAKDALDLATGGGHAALAVSPLVERLTAVDLTPEMLSTAEAFLRSKGHDRIRFVAGDAEKLPFEPASFDLIVCRIAAHHFPNPDAFVSEAARVLSAGGTFILMDNIAPEAEEVDRLYNDVEKRRDPSHVRAWTKTEWIRRTEGAGLRLEQLVQSRKTFVFESWCRRMSVPEAEQRELEAYILGRSAALKRAMGVTEAEGRMVSFEGDYMMLKARKS